MKRMAGDPTSLAVPANEDLARAPIFDKLLNVCQRAPVVEVANNTHGNVKVSVCVPTYQHARSIKHCLDSLLEQECEFPYEILIGEDGSTDGTRELCLEYASRHPEKIRLFLQSRENNIRINGYPTGRFNLLYLLSKAQGEYIALCEGDDWWTDKDKLQLQVKAMSEAPQCSVSCHPAKAESARYSSDGGVIGYHGKQQRIVPVSEIILSGGGYSATLSIMFRRRILKRLPVWLLDAPVLDYYLFALASIEGGCLYLPRTMGWYGNCAGADTWTNRLMSDKKFAVDFEESFQHFLGRLAEEVGSVHKGAVETLLARRESEVILALHLPWRYRVSVYARVRRELGLKSRLAWYASVWGLFPSFAHRIGRLARYFQDKRVKAEIGKPYENG